MKKFTLPESNVFAYGVHFPEIDTLAISDIHFGFERALYKEGVSLPSQYEDVARLTDAMLDKTKASRLLINGDVKHEFGSASQQEWFEVNAFLDHCKERGVEIVMVRGNHDNYILNVLKGRDQKVFDNFSDDGFLFLHGHQMPEKGAKWDVLVMGHEHPAVSISDRAGVRHKFRCVMIGEWKNKPLIVLPALSMYAAGVDFSEPRKSWWSGEHHEFLSPILQECDVPEFTPIVVDEEGGVKKFPKLKLL
ncbi:MAG TPA: metallophosphoesterase [Candidatus Norongarragalinales archaeon]|jgi:hypothetical protein|nr:metallophosphoesterase [Candidatus Norongarragalinales archaeon]